MSGTGWLRALGAAAFFALLGASAAAAFDDEMWSYTQPGNALVMPFDASESWVSYLTASNVGDRAVTSHWVFWGESCDHLVDVWICLTPNDTVIVDPTVVTSVAADNERVGPVADLTGQRGTAVVTAYETSSGCEPASEGGSPADDVLVGSYTVADRSTSAAWGNDAITLGLDPTGSYTELPDEELAPYFDVQAFVPSSLEESVVVLIALEEKTGSGASHVEVGPLRDVGADVTFHDTLEIPTSLPSVDFGCTLFTSVLSTQEPSLIPAGTEVTSSGIVRLSNVEHAGGPVGGTTWVFGIHDQAVGAYGSSSNAKYVLSGVAPPPPSPTPAPTATPVPTATPPAATPSPVATPTPDGEPTPEPTPTETPEPTPTGEAPQSCSTVTVTIDATYNETNFPDVSGITVALRYPGDVVEIPGAGGDSTVLDRVTNLTGVAGGLFNVGDQDDPNQGPVQITVGLVAIPGPIPSGPFAAVEMLCIEGEEAPAPGDFSCTIDASSTLGGTVDAECALDVEVSD